MNDHYREREPQWDELISRYRPGFGLEAEFYTSPVIFEKDVEGIYHKQWIFVGHVSLLKRPGAYFLYQLAGESIIIIKDEGGRVRGLLNVCRHRGSSICLEETGECNQLVCPYHGWVYSTEGALLSAKRMPQDFDRKGFRLRSFHVQVMEGLIFICLAEDPPSFEKVFKDVEAFVKPHGLSHAKICHSYRYLIKANWKIVAENFWECYHCTLIHPEFCSVMTYPEANESDSGKAVQKEFVSKWEEDTLKLGHKIGKLKPGGDAIHRCQRVPIRSGFLTQSKDGQPVAPLMGTLKEFDGGVTGIQIYPVLWFSICNDHAVLVRFTPLAPQVTEAEYTWLVREDAIEGVDYEVERVIWLWSITGQQDHAICETNQIGINSKFYRPGRRSLAEVDVESFTQWYIRQIQS